MRAWVARGASEPTANIAYRALPCVTRRLYSPTKATKWRQPSRAIREAPFASHHCRGPMPPQSRDIGRVRHASTAARQRAHSVFRAAASVLSSGRRPTTPDERVHNVVVGLGGASTACRRGGWDDRPARRAVGAAATAAERGAQAVANERGRDARGSRCARIRRSRRSTSPSKASVGIGHGDATSGLAAGGRRAAPAAFPRSPAPRPAL